MRFAHLGGYYGEGVPTPLDCEQPEGRARMRAAIRSLLAALPDGEAAAPLRDEMLGDLSSLGED